MFSRGAISARRAKSAFRAMSVCEPRPCVGILAPELGGRGTTKRRNLVPLALAVFVIVASLLSVGCRGGSSSVMSPRPADSLTLHGLPYNPPLPAPDFSLKDQHGQVFRLSDQKGRAVLLFFGYTTCPDVCPATLSSLKRVREQLGADAEKVRFVFVTVDPERDTAERVGNFIKAVGDEGFLGLTGSRDELEKVWGSYSIYVQKEEAPGTKVGYFVNHTASTFLITGEGKLRTVYQFGTDPSLIVSDLRQVLGRQR